MYKVYRSCPICRGTEAEKLHHQRFELPQGHPLSNGYNVIACQTCGLVYADTSVAQADYDRFYAEQSKYEDAGTGTGGVANPFDFKRQQDTAFEISEFLRNPQARIVDVGCANGGLLKALKDVGYKNLLGIDPSPVCVKNTLELGIEARVGSLSQPFDMSGFECVILSHTLEHVQDVQAALDWIEARIDAQGVIYLETPDATRYVDFNYAPFQDFNIEHINHFSLNSLDNLMRLRGFSLVKGNGKVLEIGTNMYYPAVFGFWKRNNVPNTLLKKDVVLIAKIREYILRSREAFQEIDATLNKALAHSSKLLVWGAGQFTMKLLVETSLAKADIVAFVDNNPINHGRTLRGVPVISPQLISNFDMPILIATLLHQQAISDQIHNMGLKNEVIFLGANINAQHWRLDGSSPTLIYGTGTVGRDVWKLLESKGFSIKGFLDHQPVQSPFPETTTYLPDDTRIPMQERRNLSIIIAIHNRDAQIPAIIGNLRGLGYEKIVTLIDLYDDFASELGERYWLAPRTFYASHEDEIQATRNMFTDETSRDLFNRLISFRTTGDYSILPTPDMQHQYFPPDVPAWEKPVRFVDCGAFDGDTLRDFATSSIPIEALAAFEPDQVNFQKLAKYVREKEIPNSVLWPCGVYSSTTQLKFSSGQGEASVISREGTVTIQCISLDEALPNFKPTLVKMDIEGAEMEALRGAQNLIQKYKPGLAISVYHLPAHIWEIPLLIKQMMPNVYSYYLRAHGFNDFDIVLYAVPI